MSIHITALKYDDKCRKYARQPYLIRNKKVVLMSNSHSVWIVELSSLVSLSSPLYDRRAADVIQFTVHGRVFPIISSLVFSLIKEIILQLIAVEIDLFRPNLLLRHPYFSSRYINSRLK